MRSLTSVLRISILVFSLFAAVSAWAVAMISITPVSGMTLTTLIVSAVVLAQLGLALGSAVLPRRGALPPKHVREKLDDLLDARRASRAPQRDRGGVSMLALRIDQDVVGPDADPSHEVHGGSAHETGHEPVHRLTVDLERRTDLLEAPRPDAFDPSARTLLFDATPAGIEGVTLKDLYAEYPDFHIDVDREQADLLAHDVLVFLHPLYWYSTPASSPAFCSRPASTSS